MRFFSIGEVWLKPLYFFSTSEALKLYCSTEALPYDCKLLIDEDWLETSDASIASKFALFIDHRTQPEVGGVGRRFRVREVRWVRDILTKSIQTRSFFFSATKVAQLKICFAQFVWWRHKMEDSKKGLASVAQNLSVSCHWLMVKRSWS